MWAILIPKVRRYADHLLDYRAPVLSRFPPSAFQQTQVARIAVELTGGDQAGTVTAPPLQLCRSIHQCQGYAWQCRLSMTDVDKVVPGGSEVVPRTSKSAAKLADMAKKTHARTLATARLVSLLRQRIRETGMAQTKVAAELGIDPTLPSKLFKDEFRNVDQQTIEIVVTGFGVEPAFFTDPNLGPNPDYRSHRTRRGRSRPTAKPMELTASPTADLPEEVLEQLEMLAASAEEREAFIDILRAYNFPFVNRALVLGIVSGIRKGRRLHQRVDEALAASIEEEGRRRKMQGDDGE